MGLYDRDYMRDNSSTRSLPRIVVILSIVASLVVAASYLMKEFRLYAKATRKPAVQEPSQHEKLLEISPLDLNTATHAELSLLPHVNQSMVTDILAARPILSVEQLDDIYGIGPKKLAAVRPHVFVTQVTLDQRYPESSLAAQPEEEKVNDQRESEK